MQVLLLLMTLMEPAAQALPGTQSLVLAEVAGQHAEDAPLDLSEAMVDGIRTYLEQFTAERHRQPHVWKDEEQELARAELARILGAIDTRVPTPEIEFLTTWNANSRVVEWSANSRGDRAGEASGRGFEVHRVRWKVLEGVTAEGLLVRPAGPVRACAVVLPDCNDSPETVVVGPRSAVASELALGGALVLIPTLLSREDTYSGVPGIGRTNQSHREWIYRPAFELGRHIIGYEVQKTLAAIDWFETQFRTQSEEGTPNETSQIPFFVYGMGEGGVIALYAAALDPRIDKVFTTNFEGHRYSVWREPIDRNLFGIFPKFTAENVRKMLGERAGGFAFVPHAAIPASPPPSPGRSGAAPGELVLSPTDALQRYSNIVETTGTPVPDSRIGFASERRFVFPELQWQATNSNPPPAVHASLALDPIPVPSDRQRRQVAELVAFNEKCLRDSRRVREEYWKTAHAERGEDFLIASEPLRERFWNEIIGRLPDPDRLPNPRSRLRVETDRWTAYDVVLDVWEGGVFAWGILLVPKDLRPGERRPTVVCQHGLEGLPIDTITRDPDDRAFAYYKGFAAELADRGFIVYAPHNPYRGEDRFRELQRIANPLGLSLFSFIIGQHQQLLAWLAGLEFVDPDRIAFYGLSYGGKTAMRVPAVLDGYCLSICSADFNDWITKCATTESRYSYVYTREYEMPEFNLGNTYNYSDLAALIFPRPFMVERGHDDGVAPDEWVASEYARVRRLYVQQGFGDRTEIEFFNGLHTIHGVGTFAFLHRHLKWPEPELKSSSEPKSLDR